MRAFFVLAAFLFVLSSRAAGSLQAPVYVILWFDTEDYLLPADDDACKRLAEMLTKRNIRATFKVVGEKARVLEKRGRQDVIGALRKHDIGYHSNFHSVHPTPAEYLGECGLLDGMAEFIRREGPGAADVRRIFNVPTLACYGQPGSSWGAQAIAALKDIGVAPHGVPCYVDDGTHIGLKGYPFWFDNAVVVYDMADHWTRMELHDPSAVQPAKSKVTAIANDLAREGGGLISIYYHPCEWVHQEFWDGVNFKRGANPPREQWKAPPQRTAQETDAAFKRFGEYIDHIRKIPNLHFVTASDLPELYRDLLHLNGANPNDLSKVAEKILGSGGPLSFLTSDGKTYSVAEQFDLLARGVNAMISGETTTGSLRPRNVLGPDSPPGKTSDLRELSWFALREAARDANDFLEVNHRIPARVFVGAETVRPEDFLVVLAWSYIMLRKGDGLPHEGAVPVSQSARLVTADCVAKDTPELFGGWIIHKEGYRAPKILEVARLQAWTLKPTTLVRP